MTEITKLPTYYEPIKENARYGSLEELKELLLFKRITEWTKKYLILEDGTKVTIEMSENDCCAWAGGNFKDVKLDAVITDLKLEDIGKFPLFDGQTMRKTLVTIYHNQNPIALAECQADNGNGGYYYSVGSLVIGDIHFPVVNAQEV